MVCLTPREETHIFFLICVCCHYSPGHLRILAYAQQDGLGVNEETPAGEREQQQDEGTSLHDDADPKQVLGTERLHGNTGGVNNSPVEQ